MEQFSLAEYLKNPTRPIVTRDGRSVRIICTDRIDKMLKTFMPIVALVQCKDGESIMSFSANGEYYPNESRPQDLFFASEPKAKKIGWMNVCKYGDSEHFTLVGNVIFPTREEALKCKSEYSVDTIQIRWEEA